MRYSKLLLCLCCCALGLGAGCSQTAPKVHRLSESELKVTIEKIQETPGLTANQKAAAIEEARQRTQAGSDNEVKTNAPSS